MATRFSRKQAKLIFRWRHPLWCSRIAGRQTPKSGMVDLLMLGDLLQGLASRAFRQFVHEYFYTDLLFGPGAKASLCVFDNPM